MSAEMDVTEQAENEEAQVEAIADKKKKGKGKKVKGPNKVKLDAQKRRQEALEIKSLDESTLVDGIPIVYKRQLEQRGLDFIEKVDDVRWKIKVGFVPNMKAECMFYANQSLIHQVLTEVLDQGGQMTPSLKQLGNVAGLPGIVGKSLGMPDLHSGYGFAIGNVAAIDMDAPDAVVSPGGVGFDINCGVRLLRTNIAEAALLDVQKKLAQELYQRIPGGVGSEGSLTYNNTGELDRVLNEGMEYLLERKIVWPEDLECCEENGRIKFADAAKVSSRAKARGKSQTGSLGSGNHYLEVQVVEEVFDEEAAAAMGLKKGNVCVMIHSGSRGLGHQVCTDHLQAMTASTDKVVVNDRQLVGVKINSPDGQNYLAGMSAAANFAFVNRSMMMRDTRDVFSAVFRKPAEELDMHMVYDVAHNIAKVEDHIVEGQTKKLLVHRKGATRAYAPNHPHIPEKYKKIGQPVLIGGSMGTCSYVLTGTQKAMEETFGSTCHGAGRVLSRSASMRELRSTDVMKDMVSKGITLKVGSEKLVAEEAPESYKDVCEVVGTCHDAGISKLCVKLRPVIVVKG